MDDRQTPYSGAETTGFQSPAQDYVEELIDLQRILDLRKPGIYPVRVKGQAMLERGIRDGDILIANTTARPAHGKVVVSILQGVFRLATLEQRRGAWFLRPSGAKEAMPVSDDAEIWAIVAVRQNCRCCCSRGGSAGITSCVRSLRVSTASIAAQSRKPSTCSRRRIGARGHGSGQTWLANGTAAAARPTPLQPVGPQFRLQLGRTSSAR